MERSGLPISIQLRTKVKQQGEQQDFYFDLKGQMVKIGDTLYIRYKEIQEGQEEIPVTIKIMPDGHVQLIRAGEMRMRLKICLSGASRNPLPHALWNDPSRHIHKRTTCQSKRSSNSWQSHDRLRFVHGCRKNRRI